MIHSFWPDWNLLLELLRLRLGNEETRREDALTYVFRVIVDALKIMFHDVMLTLLFIRRLEDVTPLEVGGGVTKLGLLAALVFNCSLEV